jgi:hypothetical protein
MLVSPSWIVQLTLCMFTYPIDTASPDYPNELSFAQGEILDIVDNQGKWWQARKADDTIGSAYCCAVSITVTSHYADKSSRAVELLP